MYGTYGFLELNGVPTEGAQADATTRDTLNGGSDNDKGDLLVFERRRGVWLICELAPMLRKSMERRGWYQNPAIVALSEAHEKSLIRAIDRLLTLAFAEISTCVYLGRCEATDISDELRPAVV